MGILASNIRKLMQGKNLKQVDFADLTKGIVSQSTIAAIFRGGIPTKPIIVDAIAKALGADIMEFRRYAVRDALEKKMHMFDLGISDVCTSFPETPRYRIPLFKFEEVGGSLTRQGYPSGEAPAYLEVPFDYGTYAYGIHLESNALFPRVMPGEVVIISQDYRLNPYEDYGVLGAGGNIHIGRIREQTKFFILENLSPYRTELFEKKEVLFAHKVVGIMTLPEASPSLKPGRAGGQRGDIAVRGERNGKKE